MCSFTLPDIILEHLIFSHMDISDIHSFETGHVAIVRC